jgi:excinuclease ABC subunit A
VQDVETLIDVLRDLQKKGNTVIVVEHNLQVIAQADHVIDLGPEGGDGGGTIVASGTPDDVMRSAESHTGVYLTRFVRGMKRRAS